MCQWFAPTKLNITFETEGKGRFSPKEIENAVIRGPMGEFISLNLPTRFVLIANHQVRISSSVSVMAFDTEIKPRFTLTGGMHGA